MQRSTRRRRASISSVLNPAAFGVRRSTRLGGSDTKKGLGPVQEPRRPSTAPGAVVSAAALPNTDPGGPSRPCNASVAR